MDFDAKLREAEPQNFSGVSYENVQEAIPSLALD